MTHYVKNCAERKRVATNVATEQSVVRAPSPSSSEGEILLQRWHVPLSLVGVFDNQMHSPIITALILYCGIFRNRYGYPVENRAYHHMHAIRFYKRIVYRIVARQWLIRLESS